TLKVLGKYQGREAVAGSTGMRNHPMRSSALLTWPNRRMRTRMPGGVGGGSREVSPYPDFFKVRARPEISRRH
ncbi:MAG: hypothetical protein U9N80_15530, partial [Chloroflexota bacterium]|nr:hypothetical protein [Chloroflexota bacterium]